MYLIFKMELPAVTVCLHFGGHPVFTVLCNRQENAVCCWHMEVALMTDCREASFDVVMGLASRLLGTQSFCQN